MSTRSDVRRLVGLLLSVTASAWGGETLADVFGEGENQFQIEFVTVGDPNNPAYVPPAATAGDAPIPSGVVAYEYRIGKYEVSRDMMLKAMALSSELRDKVYLARFWRRDEDKQKVTPEETYDIGRNKPAGAMTWREAALFVNWLNASTGHAPAYKFNPSGRPALWRPEDQGYDPANKYRNTDAMYFLPSADEWHKAAYYDPDKNDGRGGWWQYAQGSDEMPRPLDIDSQRGKLGGDEPNTAVYNQRKTVRDIKAFGTGASGDGCGEFADVDRAGGWSPYGTMGQEGNAFEWDESSGDLTNTDPLADRGVRGGAAPFDAGGKVVMGAATRFADPEHISLKVQEAGKNNWLGFRVASKAASPDGG